MKVFEPTYVDGRWLVEISYYPESRCIETWEFDSHEKACGFYQANTTQSTDGKNDE